MNQELSDQLLEACSLGKLDEVNELLAKGANVNCKNGDGRTGLMRASKRGYDKIVEKLLECGADVNARDKNNDTALMGAAKHGYRYICEELVKGGKDAGKDAGIYAGGDICPLNGKHCKHGMVSLSGKCHHVEEKKESTKNGYFTVFICEYINDQE